MGSFLIFPNRMMWYLRDGLQAVFRSGCTFTRGLGKIFYFQPGHEEYPIYHMPVIQKIIKNGVRWCVPVVRRPAPLDNAWVNPSTEEVYLSSHQK